jgi:hypothetical protein
MIISNPKTRVKDKRVKTPEGITRIRRRDTSSPVTGSMTIETLNSKDTITGPDQTRDSQSTTGMLLTGKKAIHRKIKSPKKSLSTKFMCTMLTLRSLQIK